MTIQATSIPTKRLLYTSPKEQRLASRAQTFTTTTGGQCPGYVQANLIILPAIWADDFERLCRRNPVPCPLLGRGGRQIPTHLCTKSATSDVCSDLSGYNVYSASTGQLVSQEKDVSHLWQDGHQAFYIGCSFSFETALDRNSLTPKHWAGAGQVPMYKTTQPLLASGIFKGHMVVSMRPYKKTELERVRDTTAPFLATHGEPVAYGFEEARTVLGITNVAQPDFGDPVDIAEDEIPIFHGCGVTPQLVVMETFARLAKEGKSYDGVIISHTPGHMLVTDLEEEAVAHGQHIY